MAELTIQERVAWLHKSATTLQTDDLTELKFAVKAMMNDGISLLRQIGNELQAPQHLGTEPETAEQTAQ